MGAMTHLRSTFNTIVVRTIVNIAQRVLTLSTAESANHNTHLPHRSRPPGARRHLEAYVQAQQGSACYKPEDADGHPLAPRRWVKRTDPRSFLTHVLAQGQYISRE